MDPFDTIRKVAAELHDQLVVAGLNPFNGLSLVTAACAAKELEIAWLPLGDPALKGAHALFDEQSGTICCEQSANLAGGALLVAHELGHACIHAGSSLCSAQDIDASRSSETVPIGLQRVEDYGARERRELQANIFAREFLFPRSLARRLHVDGKLSASNIVAATGLPKNLVRQQILDAILLPTPADVLPTVSNGSRPTPDPSQESAALHRGSPFQLQAGPGTGKTKTLVNRVISLLDEGIDPASILILTYSNRAAGELVERISAAAPDKAARMWVGTFHAFGLDLLRRYHDRFDLSANPPLFDRSDVIEVLEEMLPTLSLAHYQNLWDPAMVLCHIVGAFSRAKDEVVDAKQYRALAEKMRPLAVDESSIEACEKCLEIAQMYEIYEKLLKDKRAVDFGDLIMLPTLLLESDIQVRTAIQLRHRHVLVDEYQDINRASARLLKTIAGDGKNLWVVGDSRQSIYRFRGASTENMGAFRTDYESAQVEQLAINYRSTAQNVKAFVNISPKMSASKGMLPLALTAERGDGPSTPEIRRYNTLEDEVGGIASSVRELEASGIKLKNQAVLCRSNRRLNEIAAGLESRGIPVLHLGSIFEREEIRDLLALMNLVIDPFGDALVRVGVMPRYGLSLQDIFLLLEFLKDANGSAIANLSKAKDIPGITPDAIISLERLAEDFESIERHTSPWDFLTTYLLDRTDQMRIYATAETVAERIRSVAIWQFLNFVREKSPTGSGLPIQRSLDRVRQLVLLAEERDLRQVPAAALNMDAVRLLTVHGSKGLEFQAVHIPGLTKASFPLSNRGQRCPPPVGLIDGRGLSVSEHAAESQKAEEECLFFVALSRARDRVTVYLAKKQPGGKARNPSPFLDWFSAGIVKEIHSPATIALPLGADLSYEITVTRSSSCSITDRGLASYQKCPRRFFYTHILGLGSARKATAFSKTHACIYEVIEWLSKARDGGVPTVEAAELAFEEIWKMTGPFDHGFAKEYRKLASRLISSLISSGAGRGFRNSVPIAINLTNGQVVVEPNEIAELPNGTVVLRRVQTGYKRSDEHSRLDYALYQLAATSQFGNGATVEAVYLTDGIFEPVGLSNQVLSNRRETTEQLLADITAGQFPVNIDAVTCPRCPHFFICAATPHGPLALE